MKNQYFGDIRDLFKFDLIQELIIEIGINRFTYISMLTPNDNSSEGSKRDFKKAKAGYKNRFLKIFLEKVHELGKDQRDTIKIREYFEAAGIKTEIYGREGYLTKQSRGVYFKEIDSCLLGHSLIFLDPDKGLEIKNSSEQHILYSEVSNLYKKMSKSLLSIIQFKKPIDTEEFWLKDINRRSQELFCATNDLPEFITDGKIAFFILSKDFTMKIALTKALLQYKHKYPELIIGNLFIR